MSTPEHVERVIPLYEEELAVSKRVVETGKVRVTKSVHEQERLIEETLANDDVDVRRVAVNRIVEQAPVTRQEGDTLIVPIVEEVLVVERKLMLREEIRITTRRTSAVVQHVTTVRTEEASIERVPHDGNSPTGSAGD